MWFGGWLVGVIEVFDDIEMRCWFVVDVLKDWGFLYCFVGFGDWVVIGNIVYDVLWMKLFYVWFFDDYSVLMFGYVVMFC